MSWGVPLGVFVIIFTVGVTALYVRRANREFDTLTEAIHRNAGPVPHHTLDDDDAELADKEQP
jgi:hypothetical protein